IALAIWSYGRRVANTPKVCTNGTKPHRASAPAMPIMFASAIPPWMNRSPNSAWNRSTSVCLVRSPDRQSTSARRRARSTSARPYGLSSVGYGGSRTQRLQLPGQLGNRRRGQRRWQLDEVPVRVRRQAVQPVPRRRPAHQHTRPPPPRRSLSQRSSQSRRVVPVQLKDTPPERRPLIRDRLQRRDRIDRPVHLRVVRVQQHHEPVQPVVRGEQGGLPELPLLQFPVADHGEDPSVRAVEPVGQREPQRRGQPL